MSTVKIFDHSLSTQVIIKEIVTFFVLLYKNDKLKLIAKSRNIKDYKNKSENDAIKILSEPKSKISLSKNKKFQ